MQLLRHFVILSLFTFGCLLWYVNVFPKKRTNQMKKPNIVFILADDLGWADIGYNNPNIITPTIDELARGGVILNQSYVTQSCSPSRAALMSGYYPYRLGFQTGGVRRQMPTGLPSDIPILPRKLRNLGYSTYMVGKWHLGYCKSAYTPNERGFDKFYGYYLASEDYYTHMAGNWLDLHDNFDPVWGEDGTYSTYLFSNKAVEFIDHHDKAKPFFMYLAYQSIHEPLQVPDKYFDMYPSVKNEMRRTLMGMATALDDGIKQVVSALKRNGLWENTLLVFSSDNGAPTLPPHQGSNWPLLGQKHQLFEGGTRAVGFIHGNMLQKTGYTYNGMIHIVDWYPTLLSVAGGKIRDQEIDGVDVWKALSTNSLSPRNEIVYNIISEQGEAAIRIGNFKFMNVLPYTDVCWDPPPEAEGKWGNKTCLKQNENGVYLFNLKDDPLEHKNLADIMPNKVRELTRRLEEKYEKVVPAFDRSYHDPEANPNNFGGVWSTGWC
ncbi:arylsulfatase J-like isoform X2 [Ptychodera flava]|uniref:arylsulfatase J-like isoform X2 n=1 Tax=Ptychodera flava TaxID=63121 RepID=UPI00396A585D